MRRSTSNAGYDPERASAAHAFGIKSTGAPASTVIVLDRIDLKLMLYEMAKGLVSANDAGTFASLNTNFDVDVSFSVTNCVCTARPGQPLTNGNKIKLGAQLQARNDAALDYLFEVNHCAG